MQRDSIKEKKYSEFKSLTFRQRLFSVKEFKESFPNIDIPGDPPDWMYLHWDSEGKLTICGDLKGAKYIENKDYEYEDL